MREKGKIRRYGGLSRVGGRIVNYGFITPEIGVDIFFHKSECEIEEPLLRPSMEVSFERKLDLKTRKQRAINVRKYDHYEFLAPLKAEWEEASAELRQLASAEISEDDQRPSDREIHMYVGNFRFAQHLEGFEIILNEVTWDPNMWRTDESKYGLAVTLSSRKVLSGDPYFRWAVGEILWDGLSLVNEFEYSPIEPKDYLNTPRHESHLKVVELLNSTLRLEAMKKYVFDEHIAVMSKIVGGLELSTRIRVHYLEWWCKKIQFNRVGKIPNDYAREQFNREISLRSNTWEQWIIYFRRMLLDIGMMYDSIRRSDAMILPFGGSKAIHKMIRDLKVLPEYDMTPIRTVLEKCNPSSPVWDLSSRVGAVEPYEAYWYPDDRLAYSQSEKY